MSLRRRITSKYVARKITAMIKITVAYRTVGSARHVAVSVIGAFIRTVVCWFAGEVTVPFQPLKTIEIPYAGLGGAEAEI